MSTNWMRLERALVRAEARLLRRLVARVWLLRYHHRVWSRHPRSERKWKVEQLKLTDFPGWYDHTKTHLFYNDLYLLGCEAETLVLRLRALKYHGSAEYIDPRYTKLPHVRDYDLHPDL